MANNPSAEIVSVSHNFMTNHTFSHQNEVSADIENILLDTLGPKHLPYDSLIPITVVYSFIFVTGMVGNCATCIVIAKISTCKRPPIIISLIWRLPICWRWLSVSLSLIHHPTMNTKLIANSQSKWGGKNQTDCLNKRAREQASVMASKIILSFSSSVKILSIFEVFVHC